MNVPVPPIAAPVRWHRRMAAFCGAMLWPSLAVITGIASAWWAVGRAQVTPVPASSWEVSLLAGSPEADPYTRARVALNGLLALSPRETLYYVARRDSDGRTLRAACHYRISGRAPDARWWSVTAYAEDLYLFPDPGHRYSVDATALTGPTFTFDTGPAITRGSLDSRTAGIPTPGEGGMVLTLRLYQPSARLSATPTSLDPPRIRRLGACP